MGAGLARARLASQGRGNLKSHDIEWIWVPGHAGHPKNEYANDLAIRAAAEQLISDGAVSSGFTNWLERKQARGKFKNYDPEQALSEVETRLERNGG